MTPPILFYLIGFSVLPRLSDVARHLPPYEEKVLLAPLVLGTDHDEPSEGH